MQEIGIESSLLSQILDGSKTVEARLGKHKFLKLRVGDRINLREDVWADGEVVDSIPESATVVIKQLLYFESFKETFDAVDYKDAIPGAKSADEAIAAYRQFYTPEDEKEHGVVAITFSLE